MARWLADLISRRPALPADIERYAGERGVNRAPALCRKALRALPARYPVDVRLTLDEVERFAADNRGRFAVEWGDARLS